MIKTIPGPGCLICKALLFKTALLVKNALALSGSELINIFNYKIAV